MNKTNEELFIKYLKNKIRFLMDMNDIGIGEDEFDGGQLAALKDILSHFEVLVNMELAGTGRTSTADMDMRDHQ
jgi:hypothetical protein